MSINPEEAVERLNKQYKRQNEHIKESYDRVSATLPKGTKERIKSAGYSVNNFIVEAVHEKLDRLEESAADNERPKEKNSFQMKEPVDDIPDFMR